MPKPFDATLKGMLEQAPGDWATLAGFPQEAITIVDADISTVSGAADKVLLMHSKENWLLHFEFQAGPDSTLPRRMHCYNALLENHHDLPVRSVAVLLRPQADLSALNGIYERRFAGDESYLRFHYHVIRVWQLPVEQLLSGGLGTMALAPISDVAEEDLPGVIGRMQRRMERWPRSQVSDMWAATYLLMGLRFHQMLVNQVLEGVISMEESVTYQAILAKGAQAGALAEAKKTLLLLGRERFGRANARVKETIAAMHDLEGIELLELRVLKVGSWDELLEMPTGRSGRRKGS